MKRIIAFIILIVMAFALVACSGERMTTDKGKGDAGLVVGERSGSDVLHSAKDVGGESASWEGYEGVDYYEDIDMEISNEQISAGLLTAKAWNDNDNYTDWKKLFAEETGNDPAGKFAEYLSGDWKIDTLNRVKVTVKKGEDPVVGAKVTYIDPSQKEWTSRTDIKGEACLYPSTAVGSVTVKSGEEEQTIAFTAEERELTVDFSEGAERKNVIDIMFVIDATGSMGDEMAYVEAELADVISRVTAQAEQVKINLALLFYRDDGDTEKFAYSDFVNVSQEAGLRKQINVLKKQEADGGGDIPEAMDEALEIAVNKNWGDENTTKLLFLVLDAPPHEEAEHSVRYAGAVKEAAAKGIRICPLLCSGADTFCEYVTRTGAILTGGTSVFITDDSGFGGTHLDPDLPDAVVEKLNDLMVRLIVGYHSGDFGTPVAWDADKPAPTQEQ